MIEGLIGLLIAIVVIGIIAAIVIYILDLIPMDGRFKQIARVIVLLIAALAILARALPLLGLSAGV